MEMQMQTLGTTPGRFMNPSSLRWRIAASAVARMASVLAAVTCCAASLAQSQPVADEEVRALLPNPAHRPIFCGVDGHEDASAEYSTAVSKAIDKLIAKGAAPNATKAIDLLRSALCQLPSK
jgi:hypothetical protein